jgi:hypothetical protein
VKTLAIKLDEELHAQLTMLGQVLKVPVATLMLQGVREHVANLRANPELSAKAKQIVDAFEADVAVRRNALTGLFDPDKPWPKPGNGPAAKPAKPAKAAQA